MRSDAFLNRRLKPGRSSGIAAIELFNSGNHCKCASLCRCRGRMDSKRGTVSDEITRILVKQGRTLGRDSQEKKIIEKIIEKLIEMEF